MLEFLFSLTVLSKQRTSCVGNLRPVLVEIAWTSSIMRATMSILLAESFLLVSCMQCRWRAHPKAQHPCNFIRGRCKLDLGWQFVFWCRDHVINCGSPFASKAAMAQLLSALDHVELKILIDRSHHTQWSEHHCPNGYSSNEGIVS